MAKYILSERQINKLYENSLFSNPSSDIKQQGDYEKIYKDKEFKEPDYGKSIKKQTVNPEMVDLPKDSKKKMEISERQTITNDLIDRLLYLDEQNLNSFKTDLKQLFDKYQVDRPYKL